MKQPPRNLVLVGGGHANVFVLRDFAQKPDPSIRLTLIAKEPAAPYSGMLPGYVAGHYTLEDCHIDLVALSKAAGAELIHGAANGVDLAKNLVRIEGRDPVPFDILAIDTGITPDLDQIPGAKEYAIAVKPVSQFAAKWQDLKTRALRAGGPRHIAVVGGGAAGVELILGACHVFRLEAEIHGFNQNEFRFTLVAGGELLPRHNPRARALARSALNLASIQVIENVLASSIGQRAVALEDGRNIDADAALVSTRARAPQWFPETGLTLDTGGFIVVRQTLQAIAHDNIFAVGDCAAIEGYAREKAGVFAVRQGPVLARNIRRLAAGLTCEPHTPQTKFLSLVSLGGKSAIASRGGWAAAGHWAWIWKDYIDRKFMAMFSPPFK